MDTGDKDPPSWSLILGHFFAGRHWGGVSSHDTRYDQRKAQEQQEEEEEREQEQQHG